MNGRATFPGGSRLGFPLVSAQTCGWLGLKDELQGSGCYMLTFLSGQKFPYLDVAKVNILIVKMGTVSQPGKGTSRSREPGRQAKCYPQFCPGAPLPPKISPLAPSHLFPGFPFAPGPPVGGTGCTEPSPGPSRLSVLRAYRAERRIRGPQRWEQGQREHCYLPAWALSLEALHTVRQHGVKGSVNRG